MAGGSVDISLAGAGPAATEDMRLVETALASAGGPPEGRVHVVAGPPALGLRAAPTAALRIARFAPPADGVTAETVALLGRFDGVWAPSEAAAEALRGSGVDGARVAHVPAPVDTELFTPEGRRLPVEGARGFRFLAVVDWTHAMGWDLLLRAFAEEFGATEDVTLIFKAGSPLGYSPSVIVDSLQALLDQHGFDPRELPDLLFDPAPTAREHMPALYRTAHCLVHPVRGDGHGRGLLEAMSCGVPAIAASAGLAAPLVTDETGFPIDASPVPLPALAAREVPECDGASWAEPALESLRRAMRAAASDRAATAARGAPAREAVVRGHSIEVCGRAAAGSLRKGFPPRAAAAVPAPASGARGGARPEELTFVLQGPIERTEPSSTALSCESIRAHFPGAEIVVSTWEGADASGIDCDEVILSRDPGKAQPTAVNVNRQIVSSLAGIRAASRPLVVKMRSDLVFHSASVLDWWGRFDERAERDHLFGRRVLVPNVFMRRPTYLFPMPHHPSDWAHFGTAEDLERLFDVPQQDPDEDEHSAPSTPLSRLYYDRPLAPAATPEQYIWTSALRKVDPGLRLEQQCDLVLETFTASELALADEFTILDTYLQFGVSCPKYPAANRLFHDRTLYQHEHWAEIYDLHCRGTAADRGERVLAELRGGRTPTEDDLAALRRAGLGWTAQLLESALFAPTIPRDHTTGGPARRGHDLLVAKLARQDLAALDGALAAAVA